MDGPSQDDRRKYSRVGFATRIEIVFETSRDQAALKADSKDLSLKGVFVRTQEEFPAQTQCTVTIFLTGGVDEIKLVIQGKAVRQTDDGVGIEFESMDLDTYTHLKNIVRYNG